ncbi:type II toxin-antitoxin system VapC family toxin [Dietzia sp. UCD-THP]|uniref:type II toxin-antitoxin system VapC family toxin n=1 Tax=Dietzia sp. UCD-THP TaxID=1292020 RepID=UPI0005A9C7AE|nr:type II toxin-antitoxin system VapC family toxin [Dietzia sp. UCD-THP]
MLLDSHVVVWLMDDNPRLGPSAREAIASAPAVLCSAASLWELRIKHLNGKISVPTEFTESVFAAGVVELPVSSAHVAAVDPSALPHRDPFDHMLVAQARVEGLRFVTADAAILAAGLPFVVDARK